MMAQAAARTEAGITSRVQVISIGVFVCDVKEWKRFQVEWKRILDRESITCFHMTGSLRRRAGAPARHRSRLILRDEKALACRIICRVECCSRLRSGVANQTEDSLLGERRLRFGGIEEIA